MKRSVVFDLLTKIEANARFASRQGMFAKSRRVAEQRATVRAVLNAHFGAMVPPRFVNVGGALTPNRIEVRLVRISPGRTADAWENLRGALKGVKDEVAAWIGLDDREGAGITWLDPGQEQQGSAVYRVRIEITDLSPLADRVVVLAETASEGRKAKARVKRMAAKASEDGVKKTGRVLSYQPAQVASGASSAARAGAEAAFAKMTGKARATPLRHPVYGAVNVDAGGIVLTADRPSALDLRDAAAGAFQRRANREKLPGTEKSCQRDPGEERPARAVASCPSCGADIGQPCRRGGEMVHGVHVARALMAGMHVDGSKLAHARTATGPRKPAVQVPLPAYVRLPWTRTAERAPLTRWEAGDHLGEVARLMVPAEHVARWGRTLTLRRREHESPKLGRCVVYEPA